MRNKQRIILMAVVLCLALAGSALALNAAFVEKGIVDLTTNYGASGVIAAVVGVSGATDSIEVTFAEPMHPGTFGMGLNFAKAWTKTWHGDNTGLTIGGDLNFSAVADPTLIVYLMQTAAARHDIAEPNVFRFQDINVTGASVGNRQASLDFNILSANGKGYSVYLAESEAGPFALYDNVNFNAQGVHIRGLENGQTYWVYVQYQAEGLVPTRTAPVAITPTK